MARSRGEEFLHKKQCNGAQLGEQMLEGDVPQVCKTMTGVEKKNREVITHWFS